MRLLFSRCLVLAVACALSLSAPAKTFQSSYLSFEIPESWKCKSFDTDWVCHSTLSKKQKEAMIILTAKEAGTLDTFAQYNTFLKSPRNNVTKSGKPYKSKIVHVNTVSINGQPWVDGFHKGSEIPTYYTRYLVTTCCPKNPQKLAILITYSAHEKHYPKYAQQFLKSIKSLRVSKENIQKAIGKMNRLGRGEAVGNVGNYMLDVLGGEFPDEDPFQEESGFLGLPSHLKTPVLIAVLILVLGGAGYVFLRRKKSGKRRKKRRSRSKKQRRSSR